MSTTSTLAPQPMAVPVMNTSLATPVLREDGVILLHLEQWYLEELLDNWAKDSHREKTYTPENHAYLFGLVSYAGRLHRHLHGVSSPNGLTPKQRTATEDARYDVTIAAVAAMRAFRDGLSVDDLLAEMIAEEEAATV